MLGIVLECLVLLGAAACASSEVAPNASLPNMLCRVASSPEQFEGQEVTVRGIFTSDYQHYSLLIDPTCRPTLALYETREQVGKELFDAALCSEQGGLVEVSARGRIEARPGDIPATRFHVTEYSDPRAVEFDPDGVDPFSVLQHESTARWDNLRMRMCFTAGYVDPETRQRRELPQ
jgi:hypothetical protein